ncbi:MAG: hypothetical protein V4577_20375 [Bacteroidota bacterium]
MAKDNEKFNQPKDPRIRLYAITVYYIYQECFKKAGIIEDGKFDKDRWAGRLVNKLKSAFPDDDAIAAESYEQYIRDRFNMACTYINQQTPFKWIGYSNVTFDPILKYADIRSFEDINCAFKIPPQVPKFVIEPISGLKLAPEAISKFLRKQEIQVTSTVEVKVTETVSISAIVETLPAEPVKVPFIYTSKPYRGFNFFNRIAEDEGDIYFHASGDCELRGNNSRIIKQCDLIDAKEYKMPGDKENLWAEIKYNDGETIRKAYVAQPQPDESSLKLNTPDEILNNLRSLLNK